MDDNLLYEIMKSFPSLLYKVRIQVTEQSLSRKLQARIRKHLLQLKNRYKHGLKSGGTEGNTGPQRNSQCGLSLF